ncbi:MAG: TRAP-type C4-dicarboxylate transport system permease large subunit [Paracoccaceae bacterium]
MVVYDVVADTSIGQLFAAGLIPGLIMALSLMLMVGCFAKIRNYPRHERFVWNSFITSFGHAILPLFTPFIIVGGILSGIFTPNEAAAAAVAYSMFLGIFVYRTLDFKRLLRVSMDTVDITASIMMIVAASAIFAWILTANQVAQMFAGAISGLYPKQNGHIADHRAGGRLFHGNHRRHHHPDPGSVASRGAAGRGPGAFRHHPDPEPDDRPADPASWLGAVCVVQSVWCAVRTCVTAPFLIPLVAVLLLLTFEPELSMWLPNRQYPGPGGN